MGREFLHVFEEWANTYDNTVMGNDLEYREVFRNYESILQEVVNLVVGKVLEFGAGTGNLTEKLSAQGYDVIAVEPSKSMRAVAKDKQINATFNWRNFFFRFFIFFFCSYTPKPTQNAQEKRNKQQYEIHSNDNETNNSIVKRSDHFCKFT